MDRSGSGSFFVVACPAAQRVTWDACATPVSITEKLHTHGCGSLRHQLGRESCAACRASPNICAPAMNDRSVLCLQRKG